MASIRARTELMKNALPARCIEPGGAFSAVRGLDAAPIVFTVGSNHQFYVIKKDPNTQENVQIDLSRAFGVPENHVVHSMTVTQDLALNIFIAFATGEPQGRSTLQIVRPLTAESIAAWKSHSNLSTLLIPGTNNKDIYIDNIKLANSASGLTHDVYPPIFIQFRPLSTSTFDFCHVVFEPSGSSWFFDYDLQLPINSQKILDLRAATVDGCPSLFVLTREGGNNPRTEMRLLSLFESGDTFTLQNILQHCPEGARCISTVTRLDGNDDLLISGEGLFYLSGTDSSLGQQGPEPSRVSSDSVYSSPKQFFVAQETGQISIWTESEKDDVCYQEFTLTDDSTPVYKSPVVPLLSRKNGGGSFSAVRTADGGQQLFAVGTSGYEPVLTKITQNTDTRLWESSRVVVPALEEMVEFVSYTIRIELKDPEGVPIPEVELVMSTSISADLIVNGERVRSDEVGSAIATDSAGSITIILPGSSDAPPVNCPRITLKSIAASGNGYPFEPLVINPAAKMNEVVSKLSDPSELRKLKADGVIPHEVDDDKIEKAAAAFSDLKRAASSIEDHPEPNSTTTQERDNAEEHDLGSDNSNGIIECFEDFWTLVKAGFKEFTGWFIQKLKDGWAFVVELGGKVFRLIIKTISHVIQAAIRVFEFIKMTIENIIKFIGFLFQWNDIVKTKNVLVNLTTQGVIWGSDNLASLQGQADIFFNDMKTQIRSWKKDSLPNSMTSAQIGKNSAKSSGADDEKAEKDEISSPGASWGNYQLQHGGKTVKSEQSSSMPTSLSSDFEEIGGAVKELMKRLSGNIVNIFTSSPDKSLGDLLEELGIDLLADLVGVAEKLVSKLIRMLRQLILRLADVIQTEINIPVLTPLYKAISGGTPLTVLDAICLVMAIPMTISYKLFTGESPTKIAGIEHLTKPNIYLNALRIRLHGQNSVADSSKSLLTSSSAHDARSAVSHLAHSEALESEPKIGGKYLVPAARLSTAPAINCFNSETVTIKRKAASSVSANSNQDVHQFHKDAGIVDALTSYGVPVVAMLWFNFKTFPGWFLPDTGPPANDLSFSAAVVIWLSQVKRVGGSDVPGFSFRMVNWLFGGIGVIATNFSKTTRCWVQGVTSVLQLVATTGNYITLYAAKIHVDVYSMVEDYVVLIGALLSTAADATQGIPPSLSGIAWIVKNGGYIMRLCIKDSSRKGYRSGVDIKLW